MKNLRCFIEKVPLLGKHSEGEFQTSEMQGRWLEVQRQVIRGCDLLAQEL